MKQPWTCRERERGRQLGLKWPSSRSESGSINRCISRRPVCPCVVCISLPFIVFIPVRRHKCVTYWCVSVPEWEDMHSFHFPLIPAYFRERCVFVLVYVPWASSSYWSPHHGPSLTPSLWLCFNKAWGIGLKAGIFCLNTFVHLRFILVAVSSYIFLKRKKIIHLHTCKHRCCTWV